MISRIYSSTKTIQPDDDLAFPLCEIRCLSTDEKPTENNIPNGTKLTEIDTGDIYYFDSSTATWILPS